MKSKCGWIDIFVTSYEVGKVVTVITLYRGWITTKGSYIWKKVQHKWFRNSAQPSAQWVVFDGIAARFTVENCPVMGVKLHNTGIPEELVALALGLKMSEGGLPLVMKDQNGGTGLCTVKRSERHVL